MSSAQFLVVTIIAERNTKNCIDSSKIVNNFGEVSCGFSMKTFLPHYYNVHDEMVMTMGENFILCHKHYVGVDDLKLVLCLADW